MTGGDDAGAEVVARYLGRRMGLSASGARRAHVLRQITAAMEQAGATTGSSYCSRLDVDPDCFDALVAHVTVGESYFFRDPAQLGVLRDLVLPERLTGHRDGSALRVWSAGCAIGQEAYTLAMVLEEEGLADRARIVATDISTEALRVARAGVYGRWSLRAVSERQREDHFEQLAMGHRVAPRFLSRVEFRHHNLLDVDPSLAQMDVIFCRNVLIYFDTAGQERAAASLAAALAPGGWLFTGPSDPLLAHLDELEPHATPAGIVYRRSTATADPRAGATSRAPSARAGRGRRAAVPGAAREPRPPGTAPRGPRASAVRTTPVAPRSSGTPDGHRHHDLAVVMAQIRALGGSGSLDAALDAAASAIAELPLCPELRVLEAVVLLEAGRPLDAQESARAALYLDARLAMGHLVCARAEASLERTDAARRSLQRARALLEAMSEDAIVPLSDGEPAGRLLAMVAAHDEMLVGAGDPSRSRR